MKVIYSTEDSEVIHHILDTLRTEVYVKREGQQYNVLCDERMADENFKQAVSDCHLIEAVVRNIRVDEEERLRRLAEADESVRAPIRYRYKG
jgi:hypothetical protein